MNFLFYLTFNQLMQKVRCDWRSNILDYLGTARSGLKIFPNNSMCTVSDSNNCDWDTLPNTISRIYPGGATGCIFGSEFGFDVFKHSEDSLLIYFQGGGACWNYVTTITEPLCSTTIDDSFASDGIFNNDNLTNPFLNFSKIQINYCSGDVHAGNKTTNYGGEMNVTRVTQNGIMNAKTVLDWLVQQQMNGNIASPLENLIIAGSSAGSIGAQIWASNITNALAAKNIALIFDSYVGVFPKDIEAFLFHEFNACPYLPTTYLQSECQAENVHLYNITKTQLSLLPHHSRIASLVSKRDYVQISYYDALQITSEHSDDFISPSQFYAQFQRILELYTTFPNNSVTIQQPVAFIVDTDIHTYLPHDYMYTTSIYGPLTSFSDANTSALVPWLSAFLNYADQDKLERKDFVICEECAGNLSDVPTEEDLNTTAYCDAVLASRCIVRTLQ